MILQDPTPESELATVSRKTPGDGKLEITAALAQALGGSGVPVDVRLAERVFPGLVASMECTCAKASMTGRHEHHFVQCDAFRDLPVGAELQLRGEKGRLFVGRSTV